MKVVINEGCIGCHACIAVLTEEEKKIAQKYIVQKDNNLMKSTGKEVDLPEDKKVIKKMKDACPMSVIILSD